MKELTRAKHWVIFLITVLPFLLATTKPYGYYFLLLGFFLTTYWIISVGKYGSLLHEKENKTLCTVFYITNRMIFILYASSFLLMNYSEIKAYDKTVYTTMIVSMICFIAVLLFTILYSSITLEQLEYEKARPRNVIGNCILFILFPIGVWLLQPRINRFIGSETE